LYAPFAILLMPTMHKSTSGKIVLGLAGLSSSRRRKQAALGVFEGNPPSESVPLTFVQDRDILTSANGTRGYSNPLNPFDPLTISWRIERI